MEYDVIGDIHGNGSMLERLLVALGYVKRRGAWSAPFGRQAVFLGDLIDRGDEQLRVLDVVRRMVDARQALCVMGNHELNAIAWVTPDPQRPGQFMRPHTEEKRRQHAAFLDQVCEGSSAHARWVAWFATLPVALDLGGIRAVHAWWRQDYVDAATRHRAGRPLEGDLAVEACSKGCEHCRAYDGLTKGHEIDLPDGSHFVDKDGKQRREVRVQWWRSDAKTYGDAAILDEDQRHQIRNLPLPIDYTPTPVEGSPVFVGHYWLKGKLEPRTGKVACLDFSAADGGPLVAYRWGGEQEIDQRNFVGVR